MKVFFFKFWMMFFFVINIDGEANSELFRSASCYSCYMPIYLSDTISSTAKSLFIILKYSFLINVQHCKRDSCTQINTLVKHFVKQQYIFKT